MGRGLAASRQQAEALIARGAVLVSGAVALKPSRLVSPAEPVRVVGPGPRFVSRGGEKLDAALRRFTVDVTGARALDAGASTGGFTDCLLQRGAASVVAVDVGRALLHDRIRSDGRVRNLERTDIRSLTPAEAGTEPFDVVTADLSFISLTRALPVLAGPMVRAGADLVLLAKPQFEAGRAEASRGRGVIRDPEVHRRTLLEVGHATGASGAAIMGVMPSPITGQAGNVEFLLHARAHASPVDDDGLRTLVDAAVAEAHPATGGDDR